MQELLAMSINQLRAHSVFGQKLEAYFSVGRIEKLLRPVANIPLKTLRKIPLSPVRQGIDALLGMAGDEGPSIAYDDPRSIPLWERPPHMPPKGGSRPYMVPFLLDHSAPVVICVPGGGYSSVSFDHEGVEMAKAFNAAGYHAVALYYRVSPARYPAPQLDLIRAIQITRSRAEEWRILPDKLTIAGFSAGGHLCSSVASLYPELAWQSGDLAHIDARPDAVILGYPQIDLCFPYMGFLSGVFLLGSEAPVADYKRLSSHNLVREGYPPVFLWSEADDPFVKVCENSALMREALERAGVLHEYKLYAGDMHGSGLARGLPAEAWFEDALAFLQELGMQKVPALV